MELDWKIDPQSLLPEPYNRIYESEVGKDGTKQKIFYKKKWNDDIKKFEIVKVTQDISVIYVKKNILDYDNDEQRKKRIEARKQRLIHFGNAKNKDNKQMSFQDNMSVYVNNSPDDKETDIIDSIVSTLSEKSKKSNNSEVLSYNSLNKESSYYKPKKYLPPHLRNTLNKNNIEPNSSKMNQYCIKISNISLETTQQDIKYLCEHIGKTSRVNLIKDKETNISRGYAFVSFHSKDDAKQAKEKLNKHPYDNLILSVNYAEKR